MRLLFLLPALLLSACVSGNVYYAEGVSLAARDTQLARCEGRALADFPIDRRLRHPPPVFVPARRICNGSGNCVLRGGYFRTPPPVRVDVNRDERRSAVLSCMGQNGFQNINLPFCESGSQAARSSRLPSLTERSCLVRRGDAQPLVINPI